jgi:two-component system, NarL family, response regulator DesR
VEAVRDISFSVAAGEVFCLLGPNGAGKTTTTEILEGYRARSAGEVRVFGHDPEDRERALRERVGIVLQERDELPGCRVLMLTTFGRPGYLRRAMEQGAAGFLLKDDPAEALARAIRRAMRGERVVDPGLAAAALSEGPSPLTPREHDVLSAAREHATVADIASVLHLSPGTVRNYLSAAMGKVGGRNRAEAIRAAEEKGWL